MGSLFRRRKRARLALVVPIASVLSLLTLVPNQAAQAARPTPVPLSHPVRTAVATPAVVQLAPADLTAPSAVGMQTPTTAQSLVTTRKVAVAWSAHDAGSGIASFDVRVRSARWNGSLGGYSAWKSATTAHASTFVGSFGSTYCFSTRARDKDHNTSNWSVDRCTSVPLDDVHLSTSSFARSSKIRGAFNATLSIATKKGATIGHSGVLARGIAFVARTCATCGSVSVKWNGKVVASVSLAGPSSIRAFPVAHFAKPASGTVQIVVTSSNKTVALDALDVSNPSLSGAVRLQGGATYTNTPNITVSVGNAGASGAVQMRVGNGSAAAGKWTAFASSVPFALSAGDGTKAVAVQLRDKAGNVSAPAVADIVLDTTPPTVDATSGSFKIDSGTDAHIAATVGDAYPLRSVLLETGPLGMPMASTTPMTLTAGTFGTVVSAVTDSFGYDVVATDAAGNATTAPLGAPDVPYEVAVKTPPTSQDLIAKALAAGTIDYPTSLEYRVWAEFNDPQLPDAYYAGNGESGEDGTLAAEVAARLPSLPAGVQAAIAPYFTRPTSISSPYGPVPPATAARRAAHASARPAGGPLLGPPDPHCPTSWDSAAGAHFRVWSCGIDNLLRQNVLAAAEAVYAPETGDMGPEKSDASLGDANGGDGLIDIYILDTLQCRMRGNTCEAVPQSAAAVTFPVGCVGANPTQCAAYIAIDHAVAASSLMPGTIAHEFFHALQMAHNYSAMFWDDGAPESPMHEHWFTEATASWAGWHYAHASYTARSNGRYQDIFQGQNTDTSLVVAGDEHDYASWVWPLFMQQESSAGAIAGAWSDAESITTPQQFDDAISGRLDFTTRFRDFAVRNIDLPLQGNPFKSWQSGADGADLVQKIPPQLTTSSPIGGATPEVVSTVNIPVLAAQYDVYYPDPKVGKLTLDFANVQNFANLNVDVVGQVRSTGDWRRIQVDDKKLELCSDIPNEDFTKMWVVLSNHKDLRAPDGVEPAEAQTIIGDYSVSVGECDGVRAGISYNYSSSGTIPNSVIDQNYQENVTFDLNMAPPALGPVPTPYLLVDQGSTFSVSTHYTLDSTDDAGCHTLTTVDGSGSGTTPVTDPFHPSSIFLAAADPLNPFERGDTAVLTYVITYDEHGETDFSGSCSGDPTTVNLTTQTQLFTCKQNSVTTDLGGGLYGQFQQSGGTNSYQFACSANNLLSPFGVPGSLSVTGQAFLFNATP